MNLDDDGVQGHRLTEGTIENDRKRYRIRLRGADCWLGERTWVMGILNVTPDSFSDGGSLRSVEAAVDRGMRLFSAGADIVDVGGESTRPGARPVAEQDEIARVSPVIEALRRRGAGPLSVDTSKAAVARAALEHGADMVNDVSGLQFDPGMGAVVAAAGVPCVLMHLRGNFDSMHAPSRYADVVREVAAELGEAVERAAEAGIAREQTIVDPGIGFSKDAGHSLELMQRLEELRALDRPLLVGPSRKSFLARLLEKAPAERVFGTAAAVATAVMRGAHLVRVHDVREMRDVVRVADALRQAA